jgi:hypothetical protein
LEASGKIRCLADHCLLLSRSCSDQVADHNKAGGDAHPHLQRQASIGGELRNRLDQTEPGANSALGIMFMRLGVAEIGKNAVTHVFCDKATIALDQFGAAAVIGGNDAPQVLGSSLADSAVEPTKSQNMTVSWRRSAEAAVVSPPGVVELKFTSVTGAVANLAIAFRMRSRSPAADMPTSLRI